MHLQTKLTALYVACEALNKVRAMDSSVMCHRSSR